MQIQLPPEYRLGPYTAGVYERRKAILSKSDRALLHRAETLLDAIAGSYLDPDDPERDDLVLASATLEELRVTGEWLLDRETLRL